MQVLTPEEMATVECHYGDVTDKAFFEVRWDSFFHFCAHPENGLT